MNGALPRILVVDDEALVRSLVRRYLELAGHEVIEACDGEEAWDLLVTRGGQILKQLTSVGFTAVFACTLTWLILMGMRAVMGDLRVDEDSESMGLDQAEHSESAYT